MPSERAADRHSNRHVRLPRSGVADRRRWLGMIAGVATAALLPFAALAQQQSTLPNGASTLQETYQDWALSCAVRNNARACVVSQDQAQQNGQRLLAIEMTANADGTSSVTLLLPFGILLDSGITPQIDDQPPLAPVRLRTCLPYGCIARFSIDASTLEKMRSGTSLKLQVVTDAETSLTFPVSLKGLTAALDRLRALNAT